MASLLKDRRGRSPFWYCAYDVVLPDGTRRRTQRSTKTKDKKAAWQVCNTWVKAAALGDKLTPDKARQVIAAGVADVLAASGETLPSATIQDWCKRWLEIKAVEKEPSTHSRYELAIRGFLDYLGTKTGKDLDSLTTDVVLRFRDSCAKHLSVGSTNTNLRVIRACLNAAKRQGLLETNVAARVSALKDRGEGKRRALTVAEIQSVLDVCGDSPWRGLVLVGLYTGQRLGDCARLTWQQVDLAKGTIWFVTQKTSKRLSMRMAKPLADYLSALPSTDDPAASVFPRFADMADKGVSSLSNAFAMEVLIPAKLMVPRNEKKKSTGVGRTGKRRVSEVTFHSLRHSFTTMLKATGASEALAQMIVGHDSAVVSRHYTHLSADDTADSISKLPDVTVPLDSGEHR
jgi:integrase